MRKKWTKFRSVEDIPKRAFSAPCGSYRKIGLFIRKEFHHLMVQDGNFQNVLNSSAWNHM